MGFATPERRRLHKKTCMADIADPQRFAVDARWRAVEIRTRRPFGPALAAPAAPSLLGLSQLYVGGKVVGFSPAAELNATVKALRKEEPKEEKTEEKKEEKTGSVKAAQPSIASSLNEGRAAETQKINEKVVDSLLDKLISGSKSSELCAAQRQAIAAAVCIRGPNSC